MSTQAEATESEVGFDVNDPNLTRFDLVREAARRDGVEIVHYAQRFPVPGTKAERRVERAIALLFMITGAASTAFVAAYIWWPWKYEPGSHLDKWYTPVLGLTLGTALLSLALPIITWAKKLLPAEVSEQDRHDGASPDDERKLTAATLINLADETGIARRPLLKGALVLGALPLGAVAVAPIVGALIRSPHDPDNVLMHTGWDPVKNGGTMVPVVRDDMTPVRPEDVSVGGQITVFPGIPLGNTNEYADSPVLLIHLRQADADELRRNLSHVELNARDGGSMWGDFVAYSKICSHAGCPASLYEQQTNKLLCPCHQSQFLITDNAQPVFGPATRRLPMLPLTVQDGVFVAKSDFREPIGPGFWERP